MRHATTETPGTLTLHSPQVASATESFGGFARFFALRYWPWYVGGIVTLFLTTAITLFLPQLSKGIVNALGRSIAPLEGGGPEVVQLPLSGSLPLSSVPLLIVALGVLLTMVRSLSRILLFWPGQKIAYDSRSWLMRLFLRMRQEAFAKFGLGDLISRMSSDVTNLRMMCGFGALQIANLAFLLTIALGLMLKTDVTLTLIAVAPIFAILIVTYLGMPFISRYSREQQEVLGTLSNRVTESFSNVQTIQVSLAVPAFEGIVERENQRNLRVSLKLLMVRVLTFPFIILFSGLAEVLVVYFGGVRVISGAMTVGDILTFNVYVGLLGFPLGAMGIIIAMQQRAVAALGRLHEVEKASREPESDLGVAPQEHRLSAPLSVPLLEIRNLVFDYPVTPRRTALRGVSFSMAAGEHLGLCGPIGSGKSTLFALATRLYDPMPGSVFFSGSDVLDIPYASLRQSLRYMSQTVHLFSATIRENLAFGLDGDLTQEAMEQACRRARIWDDILGFPQGLDTEIGERGVKLSGGQRQRLALARMLLRPGEVMLFDDIVSAVDLRTERGIIQELFKMQRAFIITSHRPSTLALCNRVVYLSDGVVAYDGPYSGMNESLMNQLRADDAATSDPASDPSAVAIEVGAAGATVGAN